MVSGSRAQLVDELESAIRDTPKTVLVTGAAGIGKTHLLGVLTARTTGFRVLRGRARELDEGLAFAPLVDAIESLGRDKGVQTGLWELYDAIDRAALGHPGKQVPGNPVGAPAVLAAQLLESLPGRTLLAIDDIHHADADTLRLLAALPRSAPSLAILCTARQVPALDVDLTVRLEPLSRAEVTDLITTLLDRTPSDAMIDRILTESGGNPWLVQESVLALVQGGAVRSPDPGARRGAILSRVFQRDRAGRDLARVLATLGRTRDTSAIDTPGTLEAIAEVAGLDARAAERALVGLVRDGVLVYTGDGYSFAHPLVAEALYADLNAGERRRLHARIAELLNRQGLAGARRVLEWATHLAEGGKPADALAAMLRAAELTRWTAPLSAAHWYGRAAEVADPAQRGELLARQSLSYWKGSRPALALNSGQRALAVLPQGRRHTRTAYTVVGAAHAMGWYDVALTIAAQQIPRADDPTALVAQRALLLAELGRPLGDHVERAWRGLPACPPEDRIITAGCLALRALIDGAWSEAQRAVDDLLGFAAALPPGARLAALESAAHVMSTAGVRGRATALLEQAEQIHRGLGWHDIAGQNVRVTAVIRRLAGEWDRALADIRAGAGPLAEAGLLENHALLRNIELDILLDQGRYEEASAVLDDPPPSCALHNGLRHLLRARLALGLGDRAAARTWAERSLAVAPPDVSHRAMAVLVLIHAAADDRESGRAVARELDERATDSTPRARLAADLAMAWAFEDPARAGAALEQARADNLPFEEARARLILGTLGDHPQLTRAHTTFTALGATPWRNRTAHLMRTAGLAPTGALTPAERRVIELVAGGLSNPQIADELHYSRKTVEVYLTRVYAKTGLKSRVELALAVERGEL
ncbi:ATP-binding protein [Acrocarpospora catenulata]|uniref:ATP-binding protein n=1 Tax=Acrocarpospora catenulata TaxID=2836182 RepID=UPI001BDA7DDA|nr:LuxR family transcriptional regulator [Acrocarpospora catenulata]